MTKFPPVDELQQRRIARLEAEVTRLKRIVEYYESTIELEKGWRRCAGCHLLRPVSWDAGLSGDYCSDCEDAIILEQQRHERPRPRNDEE